MLKALRFQQFAFVAQLLEPLSELLSNAENRLFHAIFAGYVMTRRIDRCLVDPPKHLSPDRIDLADRFDGFVEELDPQCRTVLVGGKHFDDVTAHAKSATMKIIVAALILDIHQLAQHLVAIDDRTLFEVHHHFKIGFRRSETVNARHAGDDERIAPFKQRFGRRMAQLVDLIVDRRILFYIGIRRRHVSFRLVIIIITDEVANGIFRKQIAKLVIKLCGQRLVGRDHERRLVDLGNNVRHRERLARTGHAEKNLMPSARLQALDQLFDSLRLISLRIKIGD